MTMQTRIIEAIDGALGRAIASLGEIRDRLGRFRKPGDVAEYFRRRLIADPGASITATLLYADFCAWCDQTGREPMALPGFGRALAELGISKGRIAGRVRYHGIAFISPPSGEDGDGKPTRTPTYQVDAA